MNTASSSTVKTEVITMIVRLVVAFLTVGSLVLLFSASGVQGANSSDQFENKKMKNYPGAEDEDELTVQEEMTPPEATITRSVIEQKVLKSYFKKDKEETDKTSKAE